MRELLINIVKHAKARKVKVSVGNVDEQVRVIIEDDGVGFKPAKVGLQTGFGIFLEFGNAWNIWMDVLGSNPKRAAAAGLR